MSCFTVRAVKACSFIIYLCESQRYGTFFFGWISMFAVEYFRWTLSLVVKNCLLPILFMKVFSKPIFSIRFCLCGKTSVCWHTNSYSMDFNQPIEFQWHTIFSQSTKTSARTQTELETQKQNISHLQRQQKQNRTPKNFTIRTKQMFCSTFSNGMKI